MCTLPFAQFPRRSGDTIIAAKNYLAREPPTHQPSSRPLPPAQGVLMGDLHQPRYVHRQLNPHNTSLTVRQGVFYTNFSIKMVTFSYLRPEIESLRFLPAKFLSAAAYCIPYKAYSRQAGALRHNPERTKTIYQSYPKYSGHLYGHKRYKCTLYLW